MKTTTWLQSILAATCLLLTAGCTVHEHERVYGGGPAYETTYDYDYYPAYNVYYYPRTHVYYWNDGGRWTSGRRLPSHYEVREARREQLHLRSREPWTEHHPDHDRH